MGTARKSMILPQKERAMTACHEAGHALPYYFLENATPLHKVTIIPHGRALGLTIGLPDEDKHSQSRSALLDELVIMFGGYAAESVVFTIPELLIVNNPMDKRRAAAATNIGTILFNVFFFFFCCLFF